MTSSARPTPIWDLTGRHTTPTECKHLQAAHGRIAPRGLQAPDAKAFRQLGNAFRVTVTTLAVRAPASVDSCTLDGLTVPATAISERVAAQASFGWGGEA